MDKFFKAASTFKKSRDTLSWDKSTVSAPEDLGREQNLVNVIINTDFSF